MAQTFESTFLHDGVAVRLIDKPLIGRSRPIPVREWAVKANKELKPTVTAALDAESTGDAEIDGDRLRFENRVAASLPGAVANALGFMPQASVRLVLRLEGTIGRPEAVCAASWQNAGDTRAIHPIRTGLLLRWGNQAGRLSAPLFDLIEAVDAFNASQGQAIEERAAQWAGLKAALGRISPTLVEADDYTRRLEIMQAGAFGLDVHPDPNRIDFQPVLMRKEAGRTLDDDTSAPEFGTLADMEAARSTTEQIVDADDAGLLLAEDHKAFVRAFAQDGPTRPAYQIRRSAYVLIDEDVRKGLDVVKRMRSASEEEKRAFIRNPRTLIADALGKDGGDPGVTALFVETKTFSERVTGLGIWEKPKLPWLSRFKTVWIPETFPVEADGEAYTTSAPELFELAKAVDDAEQRGAANVEFQGKSVPLEHAKLILTKSENAFGQQADAEGEKPEDATDERASGDKLVVQIKGNLEDVEFVRGLQPRKALIPDLMPSDKVKTKPLPHQIEGYNWLVEAWKAGWPGVLLADDMGLGKTFQGLAFLSWLRTNRETAERNGQRWPAKGPVLIVAPTALLQNWIAEADRHLHQHALGDVAELFGAGLKRFRVADEHRWPPGQRLDVERLKACDWILTTYETLADNQQSFYGIPYSVLLFDEMQKIKDPSTINTSAAKAMNADFVIGLTGTPVENRIEDLWCIMDRVFDGYLGDLKTFSRTYREPDEQLYVDLQEKLTRPSGKAPAIMLRRMKEDILEGLPKKTILRYRRDMPIEQAKLYEDVVRAGRAVADDNGASRGRQLAIIQKMRSVSLYPGNVHQGELQTRKDVEAWVARSARLHQTMEILNEIAKRDEKALVFIEHREMQRRFAEAVFLLFDLDHVPTIINGETPGAKRLGLVKNFEARPRRFDLMVLSPKAAGVGLTIIEANHVVHLSRWWNPAVEDQCNDRVYRLNQTRDVQVHVPLAVHPSFPNQSFDVSLDSMLERKRQLSRTLLLPPESDGDTNELFNKTIIN